MEDTESNTSEKRRKTESDEEEDLKIGGVSNGVRHGILSLFVVINDCVTGHQHGVSVGESSWFYFIILLESVLFKLALKFCILDNLVQNSVELWDPVL